MFPLRKFIDNTYKYLNQLCHISEMLYAHCNIIDERIDHIEKKLDHLIETENTAWPIPLKNSDKPLD
jgi:hypothetical protein